MRLRYYDKAHTYWYGKQKLESVTTYINKFFSPFNAKEIAKKLWYGELKRALLSGNPRPKGGFTKYLKAWKEDREHGTRVHKAIECLINNEELPKTITDRDAYKIAQAGIYFDTLHDAWTFYPEQKVYDTELGLAGTIDLMIENKNGTISLIDWKTNKRINRTGNNYCKKPINNLKDCNYHKYALQITTYAYMLEKKGFDIDKLIIVHLLEDSYEPYYIKYEYWKPEVEKLLGEKI